MFNYVFVQKYGSNSCITFFINEGVLVEIQHIQLVLILIYLYNIVQ
jgi:hypothetical protein